MYLYGVSGHAKVIKEIIESNGQNLKGVVDDNLDLKEFCGMPVEHKAGDFEPFIVSIGNNKVRKEIVSRLKSSFFKTIHPNAIISQSASINDGSVVMAGVVVNAEARIGRHCIINTGAIIDHECCLQDYVHISPNATLCGNVYVGEGTWIGAGSTVIQGVKIGCWSQVGAGSVVVNDIPDGVLAYGVPCRVVRKLEDNK